MKKAAFDLIIFDCDGVLVDSETLSVRAYDAVYAKAGLPLPEGALAKCFGLKQAVILDKFAKMQGRRLSQDEENEIWPQTKKLFENELKPTPNVEAFLTTLHGKIAVASSSEPKRLSFSLGKTGLKRFFGEHIYSTALVKNGKPAPDIFLYVAQKLKSEPQKTVVIEDSPYGIMGAKAAGMTAIGYLGGAHIALMPGHGAVLQKAGADFVADNWADIAAFLHTPLS